MNNILYLALDQIAKISILLNPVIPLASKKVLDSLNIKEDSRNLSFLDGNAVIPSEANISNLDILFRKIN